MKTHPATNGSVAMRRAARKPRESVPMWRRPEYISPYWRVVDDGGVDSFGRALPGVDHKTLDLWKLALEARGIPYILTGHGANQRLFVPPLFELIARNELAQLAGERPRPAARALPVFRNAHWAVLCMLLLLAWHGFYMGWWPLQLEHLPDPAYWLDRGRLDVYRVSYYHEWWRTVTALTLHADSGHLFSNLLIGTPLLILLSRRLSLGPALGLTLLSGIFGNILNVFYQPINHSSIGFSTAVFGMIGILTGDAIARHTETGFKRRIFVPLMAGLAMLALLGTAGARTDIFAHLFGLVAGLLLGLLTGFYLRKIGQLPQLMKLLTGLAVPAILLLAWFKALQ